MPTVKNNDCKCPYNAIDQHEPSDCTNIARQRVVDEKYGEINVCDDCLHGNQRIIRLIRDGEYKLP